MSRFKWAALIAIPLVAIGGALAYAHQTHGHHGSGAHRSEMHLAHMQTMLTKIGASDAQKSRMEDILKAAFAEMDAAHQAHDAALGRFHEMLLAPTVDRAQLESLRTEHLRSLDAATKRLLTAFGDAAEVLSPEQRTALAQEVRRHHGG